jgi:hypothetical protein
MVLAHLKRTFTINTISSVLLEAIFTASDVKLHSEHDVMQEYQHQSK